MPAYRVASYIGEAIESVLAQRGVSCELLIGDDGSTDGTWGAIQRYRGDSRVRAWRFRRHRGAGAVRNWLIGRARGRYVAFVDADDLMLPGSLRAEAAILARRPGVGVVYGDLLVLETASGRVARRRVRRSFETWDLVGCYVWDLGTMIRRSLLRRLGGYRTQLPFMFDYDLFLRLADITRFHAIRRQPLALCRRRRGSLSDQPTAARDAMVRRIRRDAIQRRYGYSVPW